MPAPRHRSGGWLIELGMRLRFRHPLIRSSRTGPARLESGKMRTARLLMRLTDASIPTAGPGTRPAVNGSMRMSPSELENSAGRARARGGIAAAAAFSRGPSLSPRIRLSVADGRWRLPRQRCPPDRRRGAPALVPSRAKSAGRGTTDRDRPRPGWRRLLTQPRQRCRRCYWPRSAT